MKETIKKGRRAGLCLLMAGSLLAGCAMGKKNEDIFLVTMVTDTGGINDQSFNQTTWKGLQALHEDTGAEVRYIESKQASDFTTNLDRATDSYSDLVWGVGFSLADSLLTIAAYNPDISFGNIDQSFDNPPANVTGVTFRAEESSFLAGYIAGMSTKTDKVGYVGGMKSMVNDQFEFGYLAGVAFAAAERGVPITVEDQLAQSYTDAAKAKAIANMMFSQGCDIVYHSAGPAGNGVIESARENGGYAIGVDTDQSYLAPEAILTSALKNIDVAIEDISIRAMNGENIGGQNFDFGLAEHGVGIPENNPNMDPAVYAKAMELEKRIISGEVIPPATEADYLMFAANLGQEPARNSG